MFAQHCLGICYPTVTELRTAKKLESKKDVRVVTKDREEIPKSHNIFFGGEFLASRRCYLISVKTWVEVRYE